MKQPDQFVRSESNFGAANPITTGQGHGEVYGNWMAKGLSARLGGRLGNGRAPTPTCSIPVMHRAHTMVPLDFPKGSFVSVADTGLAEPTVAGLSDGLPIPTRSATGSLDSSRERVAMVKPEPDGAISDGDIELNASDVSDEDKEGMDYLPEESAENASRPAHRRVRKGKEKKKVGRPIAYRGDPNAPELTDAERRRIKRRIANRESARRVRHKRQEELEDMQAKKEQMLGQNEQLRRHAEQIGEQKDGLMVDLQNLQQQYAAMSANNKLLSTEILSLRQSLQLKMSALEDELDRRADEAGDGAFHSAFGSSVAQSIPDFNQTPQPCPSPCLSMEKQQSALDWFPSLNLDDPRAMDMLNCLLEGPPSNSAFDAEPADNN